MLARPNCRFLANQSKHARMSGHRFASFQVFDRDLRVLQKSRAAKNAESSRETDYLRTEVAMRMAERLSFVTRNFPRVLDLGSGAGALERVICDDANTPDASEIRSKLGHITMVDSSWDMLHRDLKAEFNKKLDIDRVVADEESYILTNDKEDLYDAVITSMSLHWVNDLPGVLKGINRILAPDGLFMCAMLGGDSLFELRTSLQLAELERIGGVSPRVSPLVDVKDMGALMQQAKFNLLTIDVDDIVVSYPDLMSLLRDIQAMGESNAVLSRPGLLPRDVLYAAEAIYKALHGEEDALPATFRIIFMIGWKPSPDQPKPLERGSAQVNLKDVLPK